MKNPNYQPLKAWVPPLIIVYGIFVFYSIFQLNSILFSNENLSDQFLRSKNQSSFFFGKPMSVEPTKKSSIEGKKITLSHTQHYFFYQSINLRPQNSIEFETQMDSGKNSTQKKWDWTIDKNHLFLSNGHHLKKYDTSGNLLWEFQSSDSKKPLKIIGAPTISNLQIFVATKDGLLYSFDKLTGGFLWNLDLSKKISSKPLLIKDRLYFTITNKGQSRVVCINAFTGSVIWESKVIRKVTLEQLSASKKLLFTTSAEFIYAFDLKTGKIFWKSSSQGSIKTPLVVSTKYIFVANVEGQSFALKTQNGKKEWEFTLSAAATGVMTYNPYLKLLAVKTKDGYIHYIKAATGERKWTLQTRSQNSSADLISVQFSQKVAERLGLKKFSWSLWSSCEKNKLCIYSSKNGQILGRFKLDGPLAAGLKPSKKGFWVATRKEGKKIKITYYQSSQQLDKAKDNDDK